MALDETWYTEQWAGQGAAISLKLRDKVHDEQSPYQRIEIYETETFGTLMTLDGLVMVTDRDNFVYHEMMSHPALFTHPDPKRVLIVGGGDCGTLHEVLKHPGVELAEQVELDERVTRVAEKFFPELCESNGDPRARLHFADGIEWVAQAAPGSYDVIVIDSTDPVGPAAGLFSESFYKDCQRALGARRRRRPERIAAVSRRVDRVGAALAQGRRLPRRRHAVLPAVHLPLRLVERDTRVQGRRPSQFRRVAAEKKPFPTRYYNAAIHTAALAAPEFLARPLHAK